MLKRRTEQGWRQLAQGDCLSGIGDAGKPPGSNSDTKGQVIQRRRQQILHTSVAYLNQEEGYDEMFIITTCFMYAQ